jgi:hypothetical protein
MMAISRQLLRDAAQFALRQRRYEVEIRTVPGAARGARLIAVKGRTKLKVAVRTSQRREVGLVRGETGLWKTVSKVDQILVAVPSKPPKSSDHVEVLCFDSETLIKAFEDHADKLHLTTEPKVPVFVPLESNNSIALAPELNTLALWSDEFEMKELRRQFRAKQLDQFMARVTREFAELVGIDSERVIVDFRISSKAEHQHELGR